MARIRQSIIFNRGELTDWLIAHLEPELLAQVTGEQDILLGDHMAPEEAGWPGGEADINGFVPYLVLSTGTASPSPGTPVGSTEADSWEVNYSLVGYGAQRQQADWIADRARVSWDGLPNGDLSFGSERNWHIGNYRVAQMGPVSRNDQAVPPLWEASTQVAASLSRRHGT